ncbi:rodlin, partial [Streptomyces sp. NPDC054838]
MIKKFAAGAAVAASVVGLGAAMAPQAMAIGNDNGINTVNGN